MTAERDMTCREFVELVSDLIEGQLAEPQRLEAERHLDGCRGCEAYLEQIRQMIAALRGLARAETFPRTREQALGAFRESRAGG